MVCGVKAISATLFLSAACLLASPPEDDRKAILSMLGTFEVNFSFREDAVLAPGYEIISKPYTESATEVVVLAEDTPERIILQHLLVVPNEKSGKDMVVKHWAQVWTWEDAEVLDYAGEDRIDEWERTTLGSEQAAGAWTQLVTSVDDTPRYEASGKWQHKLGISTWTGVDTRRPLPRREYTKRDDYDYLLGSNTQTVSANGWMHFQDNFKVIDRDGETPIAIAHETGLNRYVRTESPRTETAEAWWKKNHESWDDIRSFWISAGEEASKRFSYTTSVDGTGLSERLSQLVKGKPTPAEIESALTPYLVTN